MRTIRFWLSIFAFAGLTAAVARAQTPITSLPLAAPAAAPVAEDPTQQQIDKLSGEMQDLRDALGVQDKRLDALEKKINDLNDKLQTGGSGVASADDLKKLADQVQEIDKKRQADNEAILKELEKLDKALGVASSGHKASPAATTDNSTGTGGKQNGFDYEIKNGDTLAAIAKAYTDSGHKVTVSQILAANPGLNPRNMTVGKKIFIPDTNAK